MNNDKNAKQMDSETNQVSSEEWVPLSVREARHARRIRVELWPYIWMNFASILILAAALVILRYRIGAQSGQ
jgi:hypothetical protein